MRDDDDDDDDDLEGGDSAESLVRQVYDALQQSGRQRVPRESHYRLANMHRLPPPPPESSSRTREVTAPMTTSTFFDCCIKFTENKNEVKCLHLCVLRFELTKVS